MAIGVSTIPSYLQNCTEPLASKVKFIEIDFWIFESIWLVFSGSGPWSLKRPLRKVALLVGSVKTLEEIMIKGRMRVTLSWFIIYLLGRIGIHST